MSTASNRTISPSLAIVLALAWLVLNQTLAFAQILFGLVLGVLLAWASSRLRPVRSTLRRVDLTVALIFSVIVEVVKLVQRWSGVGRGAARRATQLRTEC